MVDFFGEELQNSVFLSTEQLEDLSCRPLYGRFFEQTGIFNILPDGLQDRGQLLGTVQPAGTAVEAVPFFVRQGETQLEFFSGGKPMEVEAYSLYQSLFSRNKGILETDAMADKRVVILGCGSVGSLAALELARAGTGHFYLIDPDIVEYHNICRHQCGIEDVGDLKIHALARRLRSINPDVHIETFEGVVQNAPKAVLDEFCQPGKTVFVGCADNRGADVYANRISIYYRSAFVSIGFWERALAGEIFYHIPGCHMPCCACALGDGGEISARVQANHHVYSTQESIEGLQFEPGISVDINFITTIGIKLIIDLLNRDNSSYRPRLLNHLTQYTVVCNTSDPEIGGEMVEIFSYPLQVSTSLMTGFGSSCCRQEGTCRYELEEQ